MEYRKVEAEKTGKFTRENRYGSEKITDDIYVVFYLGSSGYTLTVVLNFHDHSVTGFASGAKEWFPTKGKFAEG